MKFNFRDIAKTSKTPMDDKALFGKLVLHGNGKVVNTAIIATQNGKLIERRLEPSFEIMFQVNDLMNRVQTAVDHYIKLCKDKPEKF